MVRIRSPIVAHQPGDGRTVPAAGVLAVSLFCLLTLCGALWIGGQTDRSIARAIAAVEAERPALVPPALALVSPQPAR